MGILRDASSKQVDAQYNRPQNQTNPTPVALFLIYRMKKKRYV